MKAALSWVMKYKWWLITAPFVFLVALQLYYFICIAWWVNFNPSSTSFMREQLAVLREKNPKAELQHQWIPYQKISNHLKRAIIASEDSFLQHMKTLSGMAFYILIKQIIESIRLSPVVQPLLNNLLR